MAQLDKIIKVMLDRTGSEIIMTTGTEPYLRTETGQSHVLLNKKLAAPYLKQLVGELLGEQGAALLDANDTGEFNYAFAGRVVTVAVRAWRTSVEARIRPGGSPNAKRVTAPQAPPGGAPVPGATVQATLPKTTTLTMGVNDPRRSTGNLSSAAEAAKAGRAEARRSSSDSLEVDLPPGGSYGGRGMQAAAPAPMADLEVDISEPASSGPRASEQDNTLPGVGGAAHQTGPRAAYDAKASGGEPPINTLFRAMVKQGGSDLHLSTGERPMIRRDGDMRRLDDAAGRLKGDDVMQLLRPILPPDNLEEFETEHDTDFAYEIEGISRFRGNVFLDRRGVGCVFRTIPSEILTPDQLGLSQAIQALCHMSKGLVLVTGPTGSGKSTTLSTLIDVINRSRHDHVITIEDPIEFVHPNKQCLINQRQVGPHTDSFKRALRAALREDPDVVMVGEMRDLETMAIALETAETGHLVFGTLHTTTSYSTVDRLIDSFPSDRQAQIRVMLSESLKGVVSQTLCKKIGGGRIAAYEVLLVNSAVANIIREGKTFQIPSVMQTARKQGMVLLNEALYELVEKKKIEVREAYIRSADKANMVSMLRAAGHKLDFLQGAVAT